MLSACELINYQFKKSCFGELHERSWQGLGNQKRVPGQKRGRRRNQASARAQSPDFGAAAHFVSISSDLIDRLLVDSQVDCHYG